MPKLTKKAVKQINTLIKNAEIHGQISDKTRILITELFEILTQGHTEKGNDWLYDADSGLINKDVIFDLAGRWRFEMGLADPWGAASNSLKNKLSKSQIAAVNNCDLNNGVETWEMRFDYRRILGFTCRGCAIDEHSHVESFILNRLALCNKCQLNSIDEKGSDYENL